MLTGDFVRVPSTLSLTPSINRLLERIFDVCRLAKVMSFEGADRVVIVLIVDRKVVESLWRRGIVVLVIRIQLCRVLTLPALSDFGYLAELWLETSFTRVFEVC